MKENRPYLLESSQRYYNWLEEINNNLRYIVDVFTPLIPDKRIPVFALDFYDILLYAFPFLEVSGTQIDDDILIRNIVARRYILENPNIKKVILPSYVTEFNSYISSFMKLVNNNKFKYDSELKKVLDTIIEQKSLEDHSFEKSIIEKYPELNKFLLLIYDTEDGINDIKKLFDPNIPYHMNYVSDFNISHDVIVSITEKDNLDILRCFKSIKPNRIYANVIDAKAVQFVNEINTQQREYLFCTISGANAMNTYYKELENSKYFLPFHIVKTLLLITYDLDITDKDYYSNVVNAANNKIDDIETMFGKELVVFQNIIDSCHALENNSNCCLPNCINSEKCSSLLLENNIEKISSYIDETENIKLILNGISYKNIKENIITKMDSRKKDLEDILDVITKKKSRKFFVDRNLELERLLIDENYIFLAKVLPSYRIITIEEMDELNDFPFYIFFNSDTESDGLNEMIKACRLSINEKSNEKLNIALKNLVLYSIKNTSDEQNWLVWLLIFYSYRKYDFIIEFYRNNYKERSKKDPSYKNEFSFIYLKAIWNKAYELSENFDLNKQKIHHYIGVICLEADKIISINKDPRFLWIKLISAVFLYEHKEDPCTEKVILSVLGNEYSFKDNNLIHRSNELINEIANNKKYAFLYDRTLMNKGYILALSGDQQNIKNALSLMQIEFCYPDSPRRKEVNYKDTYAYILQQYGIHCSRDNPHQAIVYLDSAIKIFREISNISFSKKNKYLIEQSLNKCREHKKYFENQIGID